MSTNKWLDLEDWAALYKVLERAVLKVSQVGKCPGNLEKCEWKKSTRQLDITYTFDPLASNVKDVATLPTIRVTVSPASKTTAEKARSKATSKQFDVINDHDDAAGNSSSRIKESKKEKIRYRYRQQYHLRNETEEYVPDAPPIAAKKLCSDSRGPVTPPAVEYVPSKKGTSTIGISRNTLEEYDPCCWAKAVPANIPVEHQYIPNSKGAANSSSVVEEYRPDFTSKLMTFDDSYIPSSMHANHAAHAGKRIDERDRLVPSSANGEERSNGKIKKSQKHPAHRKGDESRLFS